MTILPHQSDVFYKMILTIIVHQKERHCLYILWPLLSLNYTYTYSTVHTLLRCQTVHVYIHTTCNVQIGGFVVFVEVVSSLRTFEVLYRYSFYCYTYFTLYIF